jgi:DNA polymerase III subunit beta
MAKEKVSGKITTTVEEFVKVLKNVIVQKKPSIILVLGSVRVTGTTITGTDLEVFSIVPFEGSATKGTDFLLPHRQTLDVLTGEKGPMTIEYIEKKLLDGTDRTARIKVGALEFNLTSLSTANFPEVPKQSRATLTIDGEAMKTMIDRTSIAVSNNESRYTLNATLLKSVGGDLIMVATDGHRLSYVAHEAKGALDGDGTMVIPSAMQWLRKNCSGEVSIGVENKARPLQTIRTETGTIIAAGRGGQFPNYQAVMSKDFNITATYSDPKKFADVLKRVAKCADERSHCVKVAVSVDSTILSASSFDRGSAKGTLGCSTNRNGGIEFGLRSDYLEDFLKLVKGDFSFSLRDPQSAGLLKTEDNFTYVVMPMRL